MKRALIMIAAVGLLAISAIGCHHTAGACDCITPPHAVGPHPFWEGPPAGYHAPAKHVERSH